jgi:predicted enzyme related to lactoylglutathione lyase
MTDSSTDGVKIVLHPVSDLAKSKAVYVALPFWRVPDIEAKLAQVTAAGASVKEPAHDVGGGRLVATVTDPDGNVLGLFQDP